MVSKHQLKVIKSLAQKKYRLQYGLFTVEGIKGISEFLNSDMELHHIYSTSDEFHVLLEKLSLISESDLRKISQLKTPNTAVGVFKIPQPKPINTNGLLVALDNVRDPGNLGTIIRLCDWFGIEDLLCSNATVDCYNPKVVQATMGSLTRVNISYVDLEDYLSDYDGDIFGTFMNSETIYNRALPQKGIVVMGNEANGISSGIENLVTQKISIPRFGSVKATESLNVATATAICLNEFKRQTI